MPDSAKLSFQRQEQILSALAPLVDNAEAYACDLEKVGFKSFIAWAEHDLSFCECHEIEEHRTSLSQFAKRRISAPNGLLSKRRAEKRSAFRHLYGRYPVPDVTLAISGEVHVSRNAVAAVLRHCRNVSTFLAWWNRLAPIGCGARDGGWTRWQCNQRWRKALRFSYACYVFPPTKVPPDRFFVALASVSCYSLGNSVSDFRLKQIIGPISALQTSPQARCQMEMLPWRVSRD